MISKPAPLLVIALLAGACLPVLRAADLPSSRTIDANRSVITIHVFKAGFFSAFGHEHEISAPIQQGSFSEHTPVVDLSVDARKLRVLDQGIPEKERAEIQSTMVGPKVLDSEKFSEIHFHSSQIDHLGADKWLIHGDLTLHGQSRPVKVTVEGQNGHYQGAAELRQQDFGITPVTAAAGTVKVKNEVRIQFDIFGK